MRVSGSYVAAAIGVKGRASDTQPSVPIGVAFVVDWLGPDEFNSGGLHPTPSEFVTDRAGLWRFDISLRLRTDGPAIDSMVVQLEADSERINESVVNADLLHFPSLAYNMAAGVRMRAVVQVQTSASVLLIDADWRTYFSMMFRGTTP